MDIILEFIRGIQHYQGLLDKLKTDQHTSALGLPRAARLPFLAALAEDLRRPILLLTDRADHSLTLFDEFAFWYKYPRYLFAEPTPLFYEQAAWGQNTRRERLLALAVLTAQEEAASNGFYPAPVIVASARSLMTRILPKKEFLENSRTVAPGARIQIGPLLQDCHAIGYRRVNTVVEPGQLSLRGGILDIWVPTRKAPVRLDFYGEEIDSISSFDPASQRTAEKLNSLAITPAREFIEPAASGRSEEEANEFHIPLIHPRTQSLLDYLPANSLICIDDLSLVEAMVSEVEEQAVKDRRDGIAEDILDPSHPVPYFTWSEIFDSLSTRPWIELGHSSEVEPTDYVSDTEQMDLSDTHLASLFGHDERFGGRIKSAINYLSSLSSKHDQVIVVSRQTPRLQELWRQEASEDFEQILFLENSLSEGFVITLPGKNPIHLITDSEIFGWDRPKPRLHDKQTAETPEAIYADLKPGDYVVHIDHGIGRFSGLLQRRLDENEREFLEITYDGGDSLYVPVHQADRLTRYLGPDGGSPALDHLGSQTWGETRNRVREAVQQVAQELLDLYARRQVIQGYSYKPDSPWQKELEDSFPYVETEDQKKAILEIKRDMERLRPMDRLLCGDVGYGKTEVALRAAFKAVLDGRQVAMLVPTTVLAQQHFDTFRQRLATFPVKIEMLSRFRSNREQLDILLGLAVGELDIVIGTHRLISSDVQFKDLGLVIIDEEQRFGVTHKEHLKKLRTEVDVLTLTATPIPRTLYMALTGVRDISNLNTPPEERLSIVTHVGPYSPRLVRQAVLRELERGGQIFFVHNRVQTIEAMRAHLLKLIPEARIDVGHGQMPEAQLADVMHRFTAGEIDLLLSTSIVESGLDIPNANTLIVDRADTFGLAQLYQLRGRVGRGASRAYAYFFRHRKIMPTVDGQQRLDVIAENTQLGAGYSIAMRDLEIRGAGELLGTRQHGYIQAVGFHLYTRLLADAVRRIRLEASGKPQPEIPQSSQAAAFNLPLSMPVNVDLPLAIGIPSAYIPDQDLRLRLYRRIADLRDESEIDALESEFHDRFGKIPEMVVNFFYQMRVKIRAERARLAGVNWENGQIVLRYPHTGNGRDGKRLPDLGPSVRGGKQSYWCSFGEEWQNKLLDTLAGIADSG
ncbi:MAG: transcription-repair coupling factor [Chloroflexi bacterium RBG_16_51_16]|nr:MAG: transcription-repair coupling factor [Chloroflexi bacterium RBG_16_51_16]